MPDTLAALLSDFSGKFGKQDDYLSGLLAEPAPVGLGDIVRYNHIRNRWHYWNGIRWRSDGLGRVQDMVREKVNQWMGSDGLTGADKSLILPLLDTNKKERVLTSLSRRQNIAMRGDEWDRDPFLLGFENGILDLRTTTFDPQPLSTVLVSKSVGIDWDPDANYRDFLKFVGDIMSGDAELANYLLTVLGYSLFGLQAEQKFWMWVGKGQNGKGVLARTMLRALGDYADSPSNTLYMRTRFGTVQSSAARPDLLALQGLRFTYMSEPEGGKFNEELLKAHTGEDPILARNLYARAEEIARFPPTHKIIFLTNSPPTTDDVGVAMRRRVRVIKFFVDYTDPALDDKTLEPHLEEYPQKQGILALLASYARLWWNDGKPYLPEPAKVTAWSEEYIAENDPLGEFVAECCILGPRVVGSGAQLWGAYEDWVSRRREESMSRTGFGLALGRRFKKGHTSTGVVWHGIKAKSVVEQADDEEG